MDIAHDASATMSLTGLRRLAQRWHGEARLGHAAFAIAAISVCLAVSVASAQLDEDDDEEIPKPQDITLATKDQLVLEVTYFPGLEGKNTVPVILVHDAEGSRSDFGDLARSLQAAGHAVIMPDLRGHGGSKTIRGVDRELDIKRFFPQDQYRNMVTQDMEAVKSFLMRENNEGKLNIDKLVVVGAGLGAIVASNWAALDYSWPVLTTGKQGRDVKALVLLSPEMAYRRLNMQTALSHEAVQRSLACLIVVGSEDSTARREASRLNDMFERGHPGNSDKKHEDREVLFFPRPTKLQGVQLVSAAANKSLKTDAVIRGFIRKHVTEQDHPWQQR